MHLIDNTAHTQVGAVMGARYMARSCDVTRGNPQSMLFVEAGAGRPSRWRSSCSVRPLIFPKGSKFSCTASQIMVSIPRHENCEVQTVWVRMGDATGKAEEVRGMPDAVLGGGAPCRKTGTGSARDRRGVDTANISRSANWPYGVRA